MAGRRLIRKLLKWLIIPLCVLAVLALAAWLALGRLTSPERLARLVRERLAAAYGGEVGVGGAEAHLLSGVVFRHIELRETPDSEPWASVRELRVAHRPSALLLGQFIIDAVVVVEPRLVVSKESLARLSRPGAKAEGRFPRDIVIERGGCRVERDAGLPGLDGLEVGSLMAVLTSPDPRGRLIRIEGRCQLPAARLPFAASFDGSLDLAADPPSLSLHVHADGLPVNDDLRRSLPDLVRSAAADAGLDGGAVDAEVWFQGAGAEASVEAEIELHGCSAKPAAFPYAIDELSGKARWSSRTCALTLESVAGRHGNAALTVDGQIGLADPRQPKLRLAVRALDLKVDETLFACLPPDVRRALAPYAISGPADLRLVLDDEGKAAPRIRLSATGRGMAANATPDGPRLADLHGDLAYDGRSLTLAAVRGRLADTAVEVDGVVGLGEAHSLTALRIRVPTTEIGPSLVEKLPAWAAAEIRRLGATGNADGRALVRWRQGAPQPHLAAASLSFDSAALKTEPPLDHLSGTLAYAVAPEAAAAGGARVALTLAQGRIAGIPVQLVTLQGTLTPTSLALSDVHGTVCGGRVAGRIAVKSFDPLEYEGQLDAAYVDVESLASSLGAGKDAPSGWLRGAVSFQGKGRGIEGLGLRGQAKIDRGHLYDLPLIVRVWNLLRLDLPGKGALTDARVDLEVRGSTLTFGHLLVTGQSVPMDIKGTVALQPGRGFADQKIDLLFTIAKEKGFLDSIPILGPLKVETFDRLTRQILQARATGPLGKPDIAFQPKIVPEPVKELWQLLRSVAEEAAAASGLK